MIAFTTDRQADRQTDLSTWAWSADLLPLKKHLILLLVTRPMRYPKVWRLGDTRTQSSSQGFDQ